MPNPIYLRSNGAIDHERLDLIQTFTTATLSGDSFTWAASAITLDTQDGAATNNLSTIVATNAQVGSVVIIRSTSDARRIVVRHDVGNIWSAGGDITLKSPRQLLFLIYAGAYWVVFGCCGSAADAPEVEPDEGEELKCIIATRVVDYVALMLGDVAAAIAGGVTSVALQLTTYFNLVGASPSPSQVLALANLIVSEYADDTAFETDFTEGLFAAITCYAYCAKGADDTTYTTGDVSTLQDFLSGESGTYWDILSAVFGILGADGMTNAIATGVLVATDADCSGGCSCNYAFEWESSASNTLEGCTAYVDVILRLDGSGTTDHDVDVDITTSGTATGGGDDYTLATTTVTFPAGSVDGDRQTVEVNIDTDALSDDYETIILGLDPDEGEVGSTPTHTLTILPGGCSKTWSHTFMFTVANGLQGWTLDVGNLTNSGIQTDNTFLFEAQITLPGFTVPHSSVLTRVTYVPCYTIAANRTATVNVFGNIRTHSNAIGHPNPFGPNCIATVGFTSLTETNVSGDIILSMTDNQAPNNGYISTVVFAGTGINPFTGV